jgi:hypothetical protein
MKTNVFILSFFLFLTVCVGCNRKGDASFFNGEIILVEDIGKQDFLSGNLIELSDIYTGMMNVYDSIIIFTSGLFPDKFVSIFSLNTGNLLGTFCPKGQGPNEYLSLSNADQLEVDETGLKLWMDAYNDNKWLLFNITSSLSNSKTIVDTVVNFGWRNSEFHTPFTTFVFYLEDKVLAKNMSVWDQDGSDNYLPSQYNIYGLKDLKKYDSYIMYNAPILTKRGASLPDYYQSSIDRIKPDHTKIAMGMQMLNQINILDVETGNLKGYRVKGSCGFDDLNNVGKQVKFCYKMITLDNDYIYALYAGIDLAEDGVAHFMTSTDNIHVFDWEGKFIAKIQLDQKVEYIAFDPIKKFIYSYDNEELIYRFDVSYLYGFSTEK